MNFRGILFGLILILLPSLAAALTRDEIAQYVIAPMALGDQINDNGVYQILNSGGAEAGYVFETEPLAPLPGFGGAAINMLVMLDLEGRFIDVKLIEHNEPIFVSGLGEAPFHKFLEQYRGLSINQSIVVGTPYGDTGGGSTLTYLDGVTKATASVRIAHESILAATLAVAREKMKGIATEPPARPNPDYTPDLTWDDLIAQGIAAHKVVTNAEVQAMFAGTLWANDDPDGAAEPDAPYLDLWVIDVGPRSVARAVLSDQTLDELDHFLQISTNDEPILMIESARHGLVSPDFVRNTSPDLVSMVQGGLPVALRDADLYVRLADGLPDGTAMIFRTDRRLGFDPASEWTVNITASRAHGMFQPQYGEVTLSLTHTPDAAFFIRPEVVKPAPPWVEALRNRQTDMIIAAVLITALTLALWWAQRWISTRRWYTPMRLAILGVVIGFVGYWGQGQLSIVTPLATLRTVLQGGSFEFLLYDAFSLVIWGFAIVGFFLFGRGLFCGWLCPFGAMQEFAHHLGRLLRLPVLRISDAWDQRLVWVKYLLLIGLIGVVFIAPDHIDAAVEIEPFKTAITVHFVREWYFAAYALFWLVLGTVFFKGFCRYVCPLGALMAIGGLLRGRAWIDRRQECGSPCQLCRVKCQYKAIKPTGEIRYSECFQCLDCVTIYEKPDRCVPLILAEKRKARP